MALTDGENGNGMVMPVGPLYGGGGNGGFGNNGFGGDWAWIILLLLLGWGNNGNGNGFGGGFGAFGGGFGGDFPWLMNGQQAIMANTNNGFQNQLLNDNITSIRDGVSNLSTQLCNCCSDVQMSLANGFAGVEQGANARQIANMQQAFAAQTAVTQGMNDIGMSLQNCCCENRAGIADLKYTVATENCADRAALSEGVRDIIASQTASTQRILDQLCNDKIDAKNEKIADLERQLTMANLAASQTAQTARLERSNSDVIDGLYNRLATCPVGTMPVYGNQPIFTCPQNQNTCGCGCGSF